MSKQNRITELLTKKQTSYLSTAELYELSGLLHEEPSAGRNRSRFQKGSGCFECERCHKKTRSTGRGDNEMVRLCARCYDMAGAENAILDGEMTVEQFVAEFGEQPQI